MKRFVEILALIVVVLLLIGTFSMLGFSSGTDTTVPPAEQGGLVTLPTSGGGFVSGDGFSSTVNEKGKSLVLGQEGIFFNYYYTQLADGSYVCNFGVETDELTPGQRYRVSWTLDSSVSEKTGAVFASRAYNGCMVDYVSVWQKHPDLVARVGYWDEPDNSPALYDTYFDFTAHEDADATFVMYFLEFRCASLDEGDVIFEKLKPYLTAFSFEALAA